MVEVECIVCKKKFEAKRRSKKTCSKNCQRKYRNNYMKDYYEKNSEKLDSNRLNSSEYNIKKKIETQYYRYRNVINNPTILTCSYCGNNFEVYISRRWRRISEFCPNCGHIAESYPDSPQGFNDDMGWHASKYYYNSIEYKLNHDLVLAAYNWTCSRCSRPADHIHHIIPISVGGSHDISNLTPVCKSCHDKIHYRIKKLVRNGESVSDFFPTGDLDIYFRCLEV